MPAAATSSPEPRQMKVPQRQIREGGARWWFHGHTHDSCDYQFGRTRVLCNPFGYPDAVNREFRGDLVVGV